MATRKKSADKPVDEAPAEGAEEAPAAVVDEAPAQDPDQPFPFRVVSPGPPADEAKA